jgi:aspartate/methionine/tyrosine aminotransferase
MMKAFDERRGIIVRELNTIPGFSCVDPSGAFYAFPNISKTGFAAKKLELALLEEVGVAVIAGTSFGAFGEGYLRFSYANSVDNIRAACERIRSWLQQKKVA